ncbi:hypothetical protein EVAR_6660_1 [Eumeta japonica]|uniref:Uncharacterized protein n=1 Tax=Eumeta variegata TaxID=151549 RepID=A0A4C1TLS8_EUMVA|nr:hypothetical protein EVAR_6660_1 [Eumeta japonica]
MGSKATLGNVVTPPAYITELEVAGGALGQCQIIQHPRIVTQDFPTPYIFAGRRIEFPRAIGEKPVGSIRSSGADRTAGRQSNVDFPLVVVDRSREAGDDVTVGATREFKKIKFRRNIEGVAGVVKDFVEDLIVQEHLSAF